MLLECVVPCVVQGPPQISANSMSHSYGSICFSSCWTPSLGSTFPLLVFLVPKRSFLLLPGIESESESISHSASPRSLWLYGLGSAVRGIFQARILEWVAIPFSRGSPQPRDWTQISYIAGIFFTIWGLRKTAFPSPTEMKPGCVPTSGQWTVDGNDICHFQT